LHAWHASVPGRGGRRRGRWVVHVHTVHIVATTEGTGGSQHQMRSLSVDGRAKTQLVKRHRGQEPAPPIGLTTADRRSRHQHPRHTPTHPSRFRPSGPRSIAAELAGEHTTAAGLWFWFRGWR